MKNKFFLPLLFFALLSLSWWNYAGFQLALGETNTVKASTEELPVPNDEVGLRNTQPYVPATAEKYLVDNAQNLGFDKEWAKGCDIWNNTEFEMYDNLMSFRKGMDNLAKAIEQFEQIPDLLKSIIANGNHDVCATAKPHPDGIKALFPSTSGSDDSILSMTNSGLMEPLFPPMRNPIFCMVENPRMVLFMAEYLVHDFEAMCRKLKPHSKRVFIDLGASLVFTGRRQPVITLMNLYEKFGFNFDHIYAFESKFTNPQEVYESILPQKYFKSYHWINAGVTFDEGSKLNPLESILKEFDEDDFIVLKLDIDTADIEVPLTKQILEDKDGVYGKLIDQFYFEHHVKMKEMRPFWRKSAQGTVKDTLDLFYGLREKGIPAHFWV